MKEDIQKLLDIMQQLRDPERGCPWDLEQSFESLTPYTIEEAYEVADAVEHKDWAHLKEELGDLLLQVVFYAQIGSEKNLFNFFDVVKALNEKMIHRHPHVFGENTKVSTAKEQHKNWEKQKHQDKTSVLDDIPNNFPELLRSVKLTKRAAVIGFDWPDIKPVFTKMHEEIDELQEAIVSADPQSIKDELGDVLFVCTNLARHLQVDPGSALRHANKKFEKRFRAVENIAKAEHPNQTEFDLDYLDGLWDQVKLNSKEE